MTQRILILGGGFGGIYAALHLEKVFAREDSVEVTLINQDNYLRMLCHCTLFYSRSQMFCL